MVDGRLCHCGNKGCLEAESSLDALKEYAKTLRNYSNSILSKQVFDFEVLLKAYKEEDSIANDVVNYACQIWATGLIAFIHAYDPEAIVLGGGIMKSHEVLIPKLQNYVDQYAWTPQAKVPLIVGELEEQAAMYGALAMMHSK
jgi:glucokinase